MRSLFNPSARILSVLFLSYSFSFGLSPVEAFIPMRDDSLLAADIYLSAKFVKGPVILIQTPYNRLKLRRGLPMVGENIDSSDYHFVVVDRRGKFGSSGAASRSADPGEDGYDIVEWIAAQPWSDGRVAAWGPSALGGIQYSTARQCMREQGLGHPSHLVCCIPMVAKYEETYAEHFPGGVFRTEYHQRLGQIGWSDGSRVLEHPFYDALWAEVEEQTDYPDSIPAPCFLVKEREMYVSSNLHARPFCPPGVRLHDEILR